MDNKEERNFLDALAGVMYLLKRHIPVLEVNKRHRFQRFRLFGLQFKKPYVKLCLLYRTNNPLSTNDIPIFFPEYADICRISVEFCRNLSNYHKQA